MRIRAGWNEFLPFRDGFTRERRDPCEMKPQAPHPLRLLAGLALALGSLPLHAQQPVLRPQPVQDQTTGQEVVVPTIQQGGPVIIDQAKFLNANLGEVGDYLAKQSGANLVMATEARGLPVPDMSLRHVTGMGVLRAIQEMGVPFQFTQTPPQSPGELPLWVIVPTMIVQEPQTNVTRIFNLRGVQIPPADVAIELTPEMFKKVVMDISEAIDIALQAREEATRGKVSAPVLKVHEGTRLMVISGNPQEVEIAQQVICALGGMPVN